MIKTRSDPRLARRGQAPLFERYQRRQKLLAYGDDFYIENEQGQKAFKVDGKVLRVRDTYGVEVAEGQDDIIILAVTVAIDIMAHPTR